MAETARFAFAVEVEATERNWMDVAHEIADVVVERETSVKTIKIFLWSKDWRPERESSIIKKKEREEDDE